MQTSFASSTGKDTLCQTSVPLATKHSEHTLTIGPHVIVAEIAATSASQRRGLMFRQHLAPNKGMLFMFDKNAIHCFWMKNTALSLSIAFIDERGVITAINEMPTQSARIYCPMQPIRYALEMNAAWFTQQGITPGNTVKELFIENENHVQASQAQKSTLSCRL